MVTVTQKSAFSNHLCDLGRLWLAKALMLIAFIIIGFSINPLHASDLGGPIPGDVYREYSRVMTGNQWRVTDPNAINPTAQAYLPNPVLSLPIDDLEGATRAEVIIDLWGGHSGTFDKRFQFNNNGWITIPELTTTPTAGECYLSQTNPVIEIPLTHLVQGLNTFEGTSGGQRQNCGDFGWGQWGWFGIIVRVYYDSSKLSMDPTQNRIISPMSYSSITDNPQITAIAQSPVGINKIEFLAFYEGYDTDGDGYYQQWHGDYHRGSSDTQMSLKNHVGTVTESPYSVGWNTDWIPDQVPESVKLQARIQDNNGYWYVADEIHHLTLQRDQVMVEFYKPDQVPKVFWIRNNNFEKSSNINIPLTANLGNAVGAAMHVKTWNGADIGSFPYSTLFNNEYLSTLYGQGHFYSFDVINVPLTQIALGDNLVTFNSDTTHHGIEVLWPGPALFVRSDLGDNVAPNIKIQPSNQLALIGGIASFYIDAEGSGPLSYQWTKNGVDISGANSAVYTIQSADLPDDNATFSCTVSNAYGIATSEGAVLRVYDVSERVTNGLQALYKFNEGVGNIINDVSGVGTPLNLTINTPDSVDWTTGGLNIHSSASISSGAPATKIIDSSKLTNEVTIEAWVTPENTEQTGPARIVTLSADGENRNATLGQGKSGDSSDQYSARLRTTSTDDNGLPSLGSGGGTLSTELTHVVYTRSSNGAANIYVDGFQLNSSLVAGDLSNWDSSYLLGIANELTNDRPWLGEMSLVAFYDRALTQDEVVQNYLMGVPAFEFPVIMLHPSDRKILAGNPATFSVNAEGLAPLNYQWQKDGIDIAGANSSIYTIPSVDLSDNNSSFACVVWNSVGSVTSVAAVLTVITDTSGLVSDDFDDSVLNSVLWTQIDPVGDATLSMTGTQLTISVPAGTSHDIWTSGSNAPRIMQAVSDADFTVEVKFDSVPSEAYQLQGLLVEADSDTFLRFDFYSNGSTLKVFAASFTDGSPDIQINQTISPGSPIYMQIERQGDQWTQSYSYDGTNWISAVNFSFVLPVSSVGVFVGNAGGSAPAFTGVIDYIHNATAPALSTLDVTATPGGSVAVNPDQAVYAFGEEVTLTATVDPGYTFVGWGGDLSGAANPATIIMHSNKTVTATFSDIQYELIVNTVGSGSVALDPAPLPGSGNWYWSGTDVQLTAIPDPGLEFMGWSEDLTGLDNPVTVAMDSGKVVTATFASDTIPPVISDVQVTPMQTTATITWKTDEPASGGVEYGETIGYEQGTVNDPNFGVDHSVTLMDLIPGQLYYFRITSEDGNSNPAVPVESSFNTSVDPSGLVSDDFNDTILNTALWTLVDPVGDATLSMTGTQLTISVPAGTPHDIWTSGSDAPRIMQAVNDTDFSIEVKFDTVPSEAYQLQGLLFEADSDTFLRFDFYSAGSSLKVFAASFTDGSPDIQTNQTISSGSPLYMRVERQGDQWTQSYSYDGTNWFIAASFSFTLPVSSVGVFVGNAGGNAPAYTGVVDYFHNIAVPALSTLDVTATPGGSVTVSPDKAVYTFGEEVTLTTAVDPGYTFVGWSGDLNGAANPATIIMDSNKTVTATFSDIQYELIVNTVGAGNVALDPAPLPGSGNWYWSGTDVQLTATPDPGLEFMGWSEDLTGLDNPVTVAMDSGKVVTATFATDTIPPVISDVQVTPLQTTATITWKTDEPASGGVEYGETIGYEQGTVNDPNFGVDHSVTLMDLIPGELYYFRITSEDGNSNPAIPVEQSFITTVDPSGLVSDDFNDSILNTSLWTLVDPVGDATLSMTGTQLAISVPGGSSHDVWTSGNFAPRIMQTINDTDFSIEVKFDSVPSAAFQLQGLLVEADSDTFLRFDFYSSGAGLNVFAASFTDGSPSIQANQSISSGTALYMRVERQGDQWTQSYSYDGTNWFSAASFSFTLPVSSVGVFVGNAGGNAPAYTGVVDYFHNTTVPALSTLDVTATPGGSVTLSPDQAVYTFGEEVTLTAAVDPGYTFVGWSGDLSGAANPTTIIMDSNKTVTATFSDIQYELIVNTVGSGSVALDPAPLPGSGNWYWSGTDVQLTATPDPGLEFMGWSEDLTGLDNPVTVAMDSGKVVTATFAADTIPPVISDVQVTPMQTAATITWKTDEPATGGVEYGETIGYEQGTVNDPNFGVDHSVTLMDLIPGELYYFRITSEDGNSNPAIPVEQSFTTTADPSGLVSDVFNGTSLNLGAWTLVDPVGDAILLMTGTQLAISVPGGSSHDVWTSGNFAPRIMQAASDTDFSVEVKFDSVPSEAYQLQGLLVEADSDTFLRFDFYSNGSDLKVFAASIDNGSASIRTNQTISSGTALYMRVERQGDQWTQSYSNDGTNWFIAASFSFTLPVSSVGVFVGNAGSNPPAYTGVIDYFHNTTNPVLSELDITVIGSGTVTVDPDNATYGYGEVVTLTAAPDPGWYFSGWSGNLVGTANPETLTITSDQYVVAIFLNQPANDLYENFESYAAGTDPVNWLDTGAGNSMEEDDGLFQVFDLSGEKVLGTTSSEPNIHSHYLGIETDGLSSYEFSGRLMRTTTNGSIGVTFFSQYPTTDAYYRLRIIGTDSFQLSAHGTTVQGDSIDTGVIATPNVWYEFAIAVEDSGTQTEIRAKVWQEGTAEPLNWQIIAFDDSPDRLTAGKVGVWSYLAGGRYWDDLTVNQLLPDYTLDLLEVGNGSVTIEPDQGTYGYGDVVSLTALADIGDSFAGWAGDLTGIENPKELVIRRDQSVVVTFIPDATPPVIMDVQVTTGQTSATISWLSDEPATSLAEYGETTSYEIGSVGDPSFVLSHSVQLAGLTPGTLYHYRISSEDRVGLTVTTADLWFFTDPDPALGPALSIWYGPQQSFGQIGTPQRWVNILGNVSDPDGVASLTYSLNGQPELALYTGPDGYRLESSGDFNIEISIQDLNQGMNSVLIIAEDSLGNSTIKEVVANYQSSNVWPETFTIDWSTVDSIQEVAQVVDGYWTLSSQGIQSADPGYDRNVVIGEMTWENYEVTVPITTHSVTAGANGGPQVGLIVRWQGHTADNYQPYRQWWPIGVMAYYHWGSDTLGLLGGNWYQLASTVASPLNLGVQYIFKLRAETDTNGYSNYSLKVWPAGQAEPADWTLVGVEEVDDQAQGSLMLLSHHADATFGDVTIVPLP